MSKKIAFYFSKEGLYDYPLDQTRYFEPYRDIIRKIEEENIDVYIVRGNSYLGKGEFSNSSRFNEEGIIIQTGKIKVDLIFNRDSEDTIPLITDCKVINDPEFDDICRDKLKTYELFSDKSPKTALIKSYEEYLEKIKEFNFNNDEIITLKEQFGEGGKGVFIGKISEINEKTMDSWDNILFQEFIDSSIGIDGICKGLHDIRVTVIDGKIVASNIRQPKKGSYLANFAQGGSGFTIDIDKIPNELIEIIKEDIIPKFNKYSPLLFSADFMNSKEGFKLIELNSRPGVQHISKVEKPYIYNNALADLLINTVKKL